MAIVSESQEAYLISLGLSKEQIKEMLPSEIDAYCENTIKKQIADLNMYKPNQK